MLVLLFLVVAMVIVAAVTAEALNFASLAHDNFRSEPCDELDPPQPHHFFVVPGEREEWSPWDRFEEIPLSLPFGARLKGLDKDIEWRDWDSGSRRDRRSWKRYRKTQYRTN
jgi:hypothetical protein